MKTVALLGCIGVAWLLVTGASVAVALRGLRQEYETPKTAPSGGYIDYLGERLADRPDAVNATIALAHAMRGAL